ncbi:MAG: 50S ribosomal protein L25 [Deltaproteobacteria bacterium]|nr:50S ribosomal protein L25 [Deltaproteobacteria bacterium]
MDFAKVSVEVRESSGKGGAHRVRAAGKIPGVLYGRKTAPVAVSFDGRLLLKSLDKERRRNTVFTLTLNQPGATGAGEEITAMIKDAQIDPLSQTLKHVDFLRVDLDQEVQVTVPLLLTGKPIGVVDGGQLHQSMHVLSLAAKPAAIPTRIQVDVSGLKIGEAVHVSDLKLGEGVRALVEAKDAVASVVAPKAEKVETEAAPVEGAVPAADAAGDKAAAGGDKAAAGAAGAKAGDKAAAPKKEEKKK